MVLFNLIVVFKESLAMCKSFQFNRHFSKSLFLLIWIPEIFPEPHYFHGEIEFGNDMIFMRKFVLVFLNAKEKPACWLFLFLNV